MTSIYFQTTFSIILFWNTIYTMALMCVYFLFDPLITCNEVNYYGFWFYCNLIGQSWCAQPAQTINHKQILRSWKQIMGQIKMCSNWWCILQIRCKIKLFLFLFLFLGNFYWNIQIFIIAFLQKYWVVINIWPHTRKSWFQLSHSFTFFFTVYM